MSERPISSITDFTDPFDPAYAHQSWESDDDEPATTSRHTSPPPQYGGYPDYDFPRLPPLSSSALPSRAHETPPWAAAPDYYMNNSQGYEVGRHHAVSPRDSSPERQPLQRNLSAVSAMSEVEYRIPTAPPPPQLPFDSDVVDHDRDDYDHIKVEFDSHPHSGAHLQYSTPSQQGVRVSRRTSVAHRFGGALKNVVSRARSPAGNRRPARKIPLENYIELEGVEERDESFNVSGVDLSSIEAEFVPAPAIKAMNEHQFNEDMAYTSKFLRLKGDV